MTRIVAGISLKQLKPRVWAPESWSYLPRLSAVMISYADFHRRPLRQRAAMEQGLHSYLGIPDHVEIFLDNGAFAFERRGDEVPFHEYRDFVEHAQPDWYPIPRDYIPTPNLTAAKRLQRVEQTLAINQAFAFDGFVPVIHVGENLADYLERLDARTEMNARHRLALGGIVPNLLRAPRARPYQEILGNVREVRHRFDEAELHVFGVGGTATLHIAMLLGIDSVDSSGWRNRAARGIIQLPGSGDRQVVELGSWSGRKPSATQWERLESCPCPACMTHGTGGLTARGVHGFEVRAVHNLWVLLNEAEEVARQLALGTYHHWYREHLDNSIYLPLIEQLVIAQGLEDAGNSNSTR